MRKNSVILILLSVFCILVCCAIVQIERNSKTPHERYSAGLAYSETESEVNHIEVTTDSSGEVTTTESSSAITTVTILNRTHTVQYEFLSYEIVDDSEIEDQFQYAAEYYKDSEVPSSDYQVEYVDYLSMRNDYPEVDEYISSNCERGMTAAEYQSFLNLHIAEYTTSRHPKTKYLFLRCRITNVSSQLVEERINELCVIAMRDGNFEGIVEMNNYFDCPQNTEGTDRDHSFFLYTFQTSGESIECVIGCAMREEFVDFSGENTYYVGFVPHGVDVYNMFDPALDDGFVCISDLPQEL